MNDDRPTIRDIHVRPHPRGGSGFSFYGPQGSGIRPNSGDNYYGDTKKRKRNKFFLVGVPLVALFFIIIGVTYVFSSATIFLSPKTTEGILQDEFTVSLSSPTVRVINASTEEERKLERTVINKVEKKAGGVITIYNNFNEVPQRLVKNTRFETGDGKIFRIDSSVVVPGLRVVNGKRVPGKVDANVYADTVGEVYNIPPSRFTIPGFKGTTKFSGFYGESSARMTGGSTKDRLVVAEEDFDKAGTDMDVLIKKSLDEKLKALVPEDFVLYENAVVISFMGNESEVNQNDSLSYKRIGRASVVVISKGALSRAIAEKIVEQYKSEEVSVKNIDTLTFAYKKEPNFGENDNITFLLTGRPVLVWLSDTKKFLNDVAGKSKNDLPKILANYPAIKQVEVKMTPFWLKNFPDDPASITLEIKT